MACRLHQNGNTMCRRIFITILVFGFLFPITKLHAYDTTAHKILEIESNIPGVNPNYVLLDEIIDNAMKEIKPLISNGAIPDKDVSKMFNIINGVLLKHKFKQSGNPVILLSSALTPALCKNGEGNCHYGDCDTLSFIYYAILVDALKKEGVVNQKVILVNMQDTFGGIGAHLFVRWVLGNGGHVNWETTAGISVSDKDYFSRLGSKYLYSLMYTTQDDVLSLSYSNKGELLYKKTNPQLAIDAYNEAIKLNSNIPMYYVGRAKSYYDVGGSSENYQLAIVDYNTAIDQIIKLEAYVHPEHYLNRGALCFILYDYGKAVDNYTALINQTIKLKEPVGSDYYFYRGEAYHELQNYQLAIDDYNKAIKLNSNKVGYITKRDLAVEALKNSKK